VRRYGQQHRARQRRTIKRTEAELTPAHCNAIALLRRRLQRIKTGHVLFLDETALRVSEAARNTIVLPGETAYVIVDDDSSYARRWDMIACCSIDQGFPPIIYSPDERKQEGVKGINKAMLLEYVRNILAQACGALDRFPLYLVLDRARIHHTDDLLQAFHDWGCQEMVEVILLPPKAAKRMSPLDNSIFHDWKERCRKHDRITERNIERIMADEWNAQTSKQLKAHYGGCGLRGRRYPFFDCPDPRAHEH